MRSAKATGDITLTLMTPCKAVASARGELTLQPAGLKVYFDAQTLHPTVEEIAITDGRLRNAWGDRLYRVLLKSDKPALQGDWRMVIRST